MFNATALIIYQAMSSLQLTGSQLVQMHQELTNIKYRVSSEIFELDDVLTLIDIVDLVFGHSESLEDMLLQKVCTRLYALRILLLTCTRLHPLKRTMG